MIQQKLYPVIVSNEAESRVLTRILYELPSIQYPLICRQRMEHKRRLTLTMSALKNGHDRIYVPEPI